MLDELTIHSPAEQPGNHVTDGFLDIMLFLQQNNKYSNVSFKFSSEGEVEQFRTAPRYSDRTAGVPQEYIEEKDYDGDVIEQTNVQLLVDDVLNKYSDSIVIS